MSGVALPRAGLTHSGKHSPVSPVSPLAPGMREKQHPEMSPSSCSGQAPCAPSPPAPFNRHSYTQGQWSLSIHGPPGCSQPHEGPLPSPKLLARDLWGGKGQTSGSFSHRAGDCWDFCPSGLHMTHVLWPPSLAFAKGLGTNHAPVEPWPHTFPCPVSPQIKAGQKAGSGAVAAPLHYLGVNCRTGGEVTKGKELGTSSAVFPIPLLMSSAHGPNERSSPSPLRTACSRMQSWRQTCAHPGTKLSSPALCSLPQSRQKKAHGLSDIRQPLPIQPPCGSGLSPALGKARCGAAQTADSKDGDPFP